MERAHERDVAEAALVADHLRRYRLLRALRTGWPEFLLFRARRSPDQCCESARWGRREWHDGAGTGRKPDAGVQLYRRKVGGSQAAWAAEAARGAESAQDGCDDAVSGHRRARRGRGRCGEAVIERASLGRG